MMPCTSKRSKNIACNFKEISLSQRDLKISTIKRKGNIQSNWAVMERIETKGSVIQRYRELYIELYNRLTSKKAFDTSSYGSAQLMFFFFFFLGFYVTFIFVLYVTNNYIKYKKFHSNYSILEVCLKFFHSFHVGWLRTVVE